MESAWINQVLPSRSSVGSDEKAASADVNLDAVVPFVKARASTTKNGKSADMRLHPELAAVLRELRQMDLHFSCLLQECPTNLRRVDITLVSCPGVGDG